MLYTRDVIRKQEDLTSLENRTVQVSSCRTQCSVFDWTVDMTASGCWPLSLLLAAAESSDALSLLSPIRVQELPVGSLSTLLGAEELEARVQVLTQTHPSPS